MFHGIVLLIPFLLICAGFANADSENDGYSGEVMKLFKDLTQYKIKIKIAKTKMNSFSSETWDRKYAIAIVNLYTQNSSFYITLNAEMRTGYQNDPKNIWRRTGDLINRGLDILGPTLHKQVYRGCQKLDNKPVVGKQYVFNHITSTSIDRKTAVDFKWCANGKLFDIKKAYGVSVEKYSIFPLEREVLIKSTAKFSVKSVTENETTYSIYYLEGQPEVNNVYSLGADMEENINSGNKQDVGNGWKHAFAIVLILTYHELF